MRMPATLLGLGLMQATLSAQARMHKKLLHQGLGGKESIAAGVDDFVGNVARGRRINGFFANTDIPRQRRKLDDQICEASGGPCKYEGKSMKAVHGGMGVAERYIDTPVQDIKMSLDEFKVGAREQMELLGALAPMRKDIVERRGGGRTEAPLPAIGGERDAAPFALEKSAPTAQLPDSVTIPQGARSWPRPSPRPRCSTSTRPRLRCARWG